MTIVRDCKHGHLARSCGTCELEAEVERLTAVIQDMAHEVLQVEMHCPCGARAETPNTHPHVPGCPVDRALDIWQRAWVDDPQPGSAP